MIIAQQFRSQSETRFHWFLATDAAPEILERTWMGYALASDTHKFNITEQGLLALPASG
jgi:hypothetical protein